MRKFRPGDLVIYYEQARCLDPADGGDFDCVTPHYLTVRESGKKGTLVLQTHTAQFIVTRNDDPALRRARWWERWVYSRRFPTRNPQPNPDQGQNPPKHSAG